MSGSKKGFRKTVSLLAAVCVIACSAGTLNGCGPERETAKKQTESTEGQQSESAEEQRSESTEGKRDENAEGQQAEAFSKLAVVTTIFPQYDFVRQIAGERAELKMLLKPGEETHSYEPTPQDIIAIQKSDLFIYVGGENDEWVEDILDSPEMNHVHTLRLVDCVDTRLEEEQVEGMQKARGHEHEEQEREAQEQEERERKAQAHEAQAHEAQEQAKTEAEEAGSGHAEAKSAHAHTGHAHTMDEHVWTSPVNAAEIVDKITEALCELDKAHRSEYEERAENYQKQLAELDEQFRQVVKEADRHTLLFGDRFPFRYFAAEYGLDYYAAFSGCAADTEVSAATMAFLINKVRDEKLPVILKMELSNENIANAISEATGAEVKVFYSSHNISAEQFAGGVTYLDLMRENVETLKEALREWH